MINSLYNLDNYDLDAGSSKEQSATYDVQLVYRTGVILMTHASILVFIAASSKAFCIEKPIQN